MLPLVLKLHNYVVVNSLWMAGCVKLKPESGKANDTFGSSYVLYFPNGPCVLYADYLKN